MPMPNFCGSRSFDRSIFGDQLLGERAAHALADQRIFAEQLHAAGKARAWLAVLLDAHVAGGDADDRALVVIEHFGGGKARIDLDAEAFGLFGQPATDIAERDDVIAVIVHQRRHGEIRQADRAGGAEQQELVVGHFGLEGMPLLLAPAGQQPVDADGIDNRAREDMRTDFGALFEHDDRKLRIDLLQPDGGRETGRPGTDDDHVEFHAFALGQFLWLAHLVISSLARLFCAVLFPIPDVRHDKYGPTCRASLRRQPSAFAHEVMRQDTNI